MLSTCNLFPNIGPLNFSVCCLSFIHEILRAQFGLDRVRKVVFSLRKLETKMFKKGGETDLIKYLYINLAISSCPD